MKNILWLCNTPMPSIARKLGMGAYKESWLDAISNILKKNSNVKLSVMFPQYKVKHTIKGVCDGINYWGIYYMSMKKGMKNTVKQLKPDIIHVFGTEFSHTFDLVESIGNIIPIVISIQGLVSVYALYYLNGIPIKNSLIPRFCVNRLESMIQGRNDFIKRGVAEIKAIKKCKYIIGRTDWDAACVGRLNPGCKYFKCNEIMREIFYNEKWKMEKVEKYSLFISQGNYPIKGLHNIIKALPDIVKVFPNVKVYVAGDKTFLAGKYMTTYGKYICSLLKKHSLEDKIVFLGALNGEQMCRRFLKSHVAVMPSNIENSPNSLGEAMLLGVPSIAAYVGGIPNLLKHGEEGFLYQADAPYMLAYYILKLFQNEELCNQFSCQAMLRAHKLYDVNKNIRCLISIYDDIIESCRKIN